MEKKQSSIDYFFEEVVKWNTRPWLYASDGGLEGIREKAKAMHKDEIVDAYSEALYDHRQEDGEQYYNETFGGEI